MLYISAFCYKISQDALCKKWRVPTARDSQIGKQFSDF